MIDIHFRVRPFYFFFIFALVYICSAIILGRFATPHDAYFDRLAQSFLMGKLDISGQATNFDLCLQNGKWFVPFPPMPAILMMPIVAIGGLSFCNTIWIGAFLGGFNVAMAWSILQALSRLKMTDQSNSGNLWLTLLFGLGCVHWYMSTIGSVWFIAQICATSFLLLAIWLSVTGKPAWVVGAALVGALLTRPHIVLAIPFLFGISRQLLLGDAKRFLSKKTLSWAAQMAMPLIVGGIALLAYNNARFGNPFDFGYSRALVATSLQADLQIYGQFNVHFVMRNIQAMFFSLPVWDSDAGKLVPDSHGLSLFITTPALLFLADIKRKSPLIIGSWCSICLLLIPLVLYYNTGWAQFGYRFSLDFMPIILVLLASIPAKTLDWRFRALVAVGIIVNAWGTWWFQNPNI